MRGSPPVGNELIDELADGFSSTLARSASILCISRVTSVDVEATDGAPLSTLADAIESTDTRD